MSDLDTVVDTLYEATLGKHLEHFDAATGYNTPQIETPVLTLADLDAQIAQTQAVVNQLRGELAASEVYIALTRMSGGLDALKAMRAMLEKSS